MTINPLDIPINSSQDPALPTRLHACPYLGVIDDPDTVVSFPSGANHCYRFKKPAYVQLSDQAELCLTAHYEDCHIYQNRSNTASDWSGRAVSSPRSHRLLWRTLAAVVMVMLIVLSALLWWPEFGITAEDASVGAQAVQLVAADPTAGATATTIATAPPVRQSAVAPVATAGADTAVEEEEADTPALIAEPTATATAEPTAVPTPEPTPFVALVNDLAGLPDLFLSFQSGAEAPLEDDSGRDFQGPVNYGAKDSAAPAGGTDLIILRPSPDLDSDLFLSLSRRELLTLLGRDATSSWVKVRSESGLEGWVNIRESDASSWAEGLPVIATTAVDGENASVSTSLPVASLAAATAAMPLQSAPGAGYTAVTTLESGQIVGLLGTWHDGPWVRVRLDSGLEGWLDSTLLAGMS